VVRVLYDSAARSRVLFLTRLQTRQVCNLIPSSTNIVRNIYLSSYLGCLGTKRIVFGGQYLTKMVRCLPPSLHPAVVKTVARGGEEKLYSPYQYRWGLPSM
jgi:hypothetical protein